jgi:SpoVK/Ycf46/Vps4 family AAA+-type ATPase
MTTNHPELIDEAAIRSGRVDFRLELNQCDSHQLYYMFFKFFEDEEKAKEFSTLVPAHKYSPANIQERLLKSKSSDEALTAFRG